MNVILNSRETVSKEEVQQVTNKIIHVLAENECSYEKALFLLEQVENSLQSIAIISVKYRKAKTTK